MNRDSRTASIIANSIRLHREQDPKTVVILEGSTDKRVFEEIFDITKCRLVFSSSREKAVQILEEFDNHPLDGIIAIIDKESDNLDGFLWNKPNLFFTDSHDLETMIIQSDALKIFLKEFGLTEGKRKQKNLDNIVDQVRQLLINATLHIGYLRWYSCPQKQNLQLSFKKLDFEKIMDKKTLSLNFDILLRGIKKVSPECKCKDFTKIRDEIEQHISQKTFDPWDVCSGHDMVFMFSIGLKNGLGNSRCDSMTADCLDGILRVTYRESHFQSTRVYHSIQSWEGMNSPFKILK